MAKALALQGITKRFPLVLANDRIGLDLEWGEVLALVGENGAGKSTLMRIVYGLLPPDRGEMWVAGRPYRPKSPLDAIRAGIGMVHQHFMLVEPFTVLENLVLGLEPGSPFFLNLEQARRRASALMEELGFQVPLDERIENLPVGLQQRVEILKALYREAKILILDEPTAVLTPQEAEELFRFLRAYAAKGNAAIFISHKLKEVLQVSDRVTVIRDGRVVGTVRTPATSLEELARMMVGREVVLRVPKGPARPGEVVLEVEGLEAPPRLKGVSFRVRSGEIVGIAGVEGNGQTELVEALTGLRPHRGVVRYLGKPLPPLARRVREAGVSHIPEDRQARGLVLDFSVRENAVLGDQHRRPFRGFLGFLDGDRLEAHARELVETFDVRPRSTGLSARRFSGGNQQKIVVGRELLRAPRLLVAAQPTRGVDVGAIEFIHQRLVEARDRGLAVLLVSADLSEVLSLADRILVMYEGRIVGELTPEEAKGQPEGYLEERLGLLMAGVPA
ncbi:ABC transporter ATP-binding protein [Thermus thermamylovorans]|uniref:ABC transporter ATP-binding protein n=1 Tax=Thermus thermamylovorans TaxID=2509362 RepID=A0A4Q9B4I6_9DEIN|nr:ABC transporter ATP-binding protein [Thermus thermamylovorans]TBH20023.1 ABC transporter ATP-binding protein [Thermus thermamylovorans]